MAVVNWVHEVWSGELWFSAIVHINSKKLTLLSFYRDIARWLYFKYFQCYFSEPPLQESQASLIKTLHCINLMSSLIILLYPEHLSHNHQYHKTSNHHYHTTTLGRVWGGGPSNVFITMTQPPLSHKKLYLIIMYRVRSLLIEPGGVGCP